MGASQQDDTATHSSLSFITDAQKNKTAVSNMFRNSYQSGFLSILYSIGSKPLQIWQQNVKNGHVKRITDEDIQSLVVEIMGSNVSTTSIICPGDATKTLGIKLPFLVIIVKNMKKYFTFEVQVLDDKNERRRFRASNYQSTTRVKPFICTMPMRLDDGWNQIQFNLADFTRRAYGTNYVETLRVSVHANCRLRRVYFSDRLYAEQELPPEFKLYLPLQQPQQQQAEKLGPISDKFQDHLMEASEAMQQQRNQQKVKMEAKVAAQAAGNAQNESLAENHHHFTTAAAEVKQETKVKIKQEIMS